VLDVSEVLFVFDFESSTGREALTYCLSLELEHVVWCERLRVRERSAE